MKQKLLVSENRDAANRRINEMRNAARQASNLIEFYNKGPVLSPIVTAEQAKQFLTSPKEYLDNAVLSQTGVSFGNGNVKPIPGQVAAFFGMPYGLIVNKINECLVHLYDLSAFSFDEGSHQVVITPEAEAKIKEDSKIYLSDPEMIEEYTVVKKLCDDLNGHAEQYNILPHDLNRAASALSLKAAVKASGQGWELIPDVDAIRKHLKKA